jgi:branched-chain amino acid transport system substrate-binding protein
VRVLPSSIFPSGLLYLKEERNDMRKVALLALVVVLVAAFAAFPASARQEKPIKIGLVIDETGVGAIFAPSQIAGLEVALAQINAEGGILGRQVEYIKRDSQLDPAVGANVAREMILEDKVDFLLGPTSSSVALAVAEVALENKVPLALHTSNSVAITTTNFNPYIVQLVPNTTIEARSVATFIAELDFTDWATIGPDYAFGRDSYKAFEPRFLELKPDAKIVNSQWPPLAERDLSPYITAMLANQPEAIYSILWGEQLVTFVQQANDLGLFEEAQFVGLFDVDFMKAIGDELPEGLLGYSRAPFYAIDTPEMAAFVEEYLEVSGGVYPSDWGVMIYDAVMTLKAAAEAAGTVEGPAVSEALGGLTFMSLRGELTIRACDHMANVGEYVGITTQDSEYGFPILTDVRYIPAEETWNSCEEIEAIRANAG